MKLLYFADTDTLAIDLRDEPATETRDLTEDVLVDYNAQRQIVALTIEHASRNVHLANVQIEGLSDLVVRARIAAPASAS